MAERVIETADLSRIENNLAIVFNNLDILDGRVQQVSNNVNFVSDELSKLARDFHEYVEVAARQTERICRWISCSVTDRMSVLLQ